MREEGEEREKGEESERETRKGDMWGREGETERIRKGEREERV